MLSFDIPSLRSAAIPVNDRLAADDDVWDSNDPRPVDGVRVTGRLSASPGGQYYFHGRLGGEVSTECRRCLIDVRVPVDEEVQVLFVEQGAAGDDDPDVYPVDERAQEIDLRPAIREQWLLSAPSFALCREDCKGLCPSCGTDLNLGACGCTTAARDPRWAALEHLRQNSK